MIKITIKGEEGHRVYNEDLTLEIFNTENINVSETGLVLEY